MKETPQTSRSVSWKDSNLAYIGSDLHRKIKEAAANGEPQWDGIGEGVGLHVWRIEKFRVVRWPKSKYGKFHTGDSYVVLNTYKNDDPSLTFSKLSHDLHIWIGSESTQDEYGTAAYKMVEADEKLGGIAVQHREVQYKESDLFRSYFDYKLTYLEGGVESGFHHVEPTVAEPHLYKVKGTKRGIAMTQMSVRRNSMNSGDVFILHAGDKVWLWNGKESNTEEKVKGMEVARAFVTKENVVVLDEGVHDGEEEAAEFWKFMPSKKSRLGGMLTKSLKVQDADDEDIYVKSFVPVLVRLPDKGYGKMKLVAKAKGVDGGAAGLGQPKIKRTALNEKHGYLLDTGFHVYIWLGKGVDTSLRVAAFPFSNQYFKRWKRPILPVTICKDGQEVVGFQHYFYDAQSTSCKCTVM